MSGGHTSVRRILIPIDLSARSAPGVAYGLGLARELGAEASVLHVATSDEAAKKSAPELERLRAVLEQPEHAPPIETRIGDPAKTIIAAAHEGGYDLIVIGTRPRLGLADYLLGSVAMRVVEAAPCPVLCLRPDPTR